MSNLDVKLKVLWEYGPIKGIEIPDYIISNLNPKFPLRPYQEEAIKRFIFYVEKFPDRIKPTQLLFNMATGSGKTLIMAACILYLYNKDFKNFIFFVNRTNIIEKTKGNFLNKLSTKYLFNDKIIFNNKNILVKQVDNFEGVSSDNINIVFTTIQGLHESLNNPRENSITYEDFEDKKIIMLSDEAHHINTLTKTANQLTKSEQNNVNSWEFTVNRIFKSNIENIMLEFTATVPDHQSVKEKYNDKIIFEYTLKQFRIDGYSKEVNVLRADLSPIERALQAVIISQYRKKVAEKYGIHLKPVILMKSNYVNPPSSRDVDEEDKKVVSAEFEEEFHNKIKMLSTDEIVKLKGNGNTILSEAFSYFERNNISIENLIREIQIDFAEERTLSVNSKVDSEEKQLIVNSLEDKNNEVRVIFAVDMLNEGWDVLNLFDIVRLYNTRDARRNRPGPTTISEAQLIGRGARYFPFKIDDEQDLYKRKYDDEIEKDIRILEELHYHSANNVRYIQELETALKESGIIPETNKEVQLKIKNNIKSTDFWRKEVLYENEREIDARKEIKCFADIGLDNLLFSYNLLTGLVREDVIFNGIKSEKIEMITKDFNLRDFGVNIIRKAINRIEFYKFNNLTIFFPNLKSISEFITSNSYLGKTKVEVTSSEDKLANLDPDDKLQVTLAALSELRNQITKDYTKYKGTKLFKPKKVKELLKDKFLKIPIEINSKETGQPMSESINLDLKLKLDEKEWYIFDENYGTSEEKYLIKFIDKNLEELKKKYKDIFLLRNANFIKIFNFSDGRAFEPDFILFLKEIDTEKSLFYQIFLESKGEHLIEHDKWKEEFLEAIESEHEIVTLLESDKYKLIGLPFYNRADETLFSEAFIDKLKLT